MRLSDFDYSLPPGSIAQHPAHPRDSSRLLVLDRASGGMRHVVFRDLPELLRADDLLVWNDTRVFPARIRGRKEGSGGRCEVFLLEPRAGGEDAGGRWEEWRALLAAGRPPRAGARIVLPGGMTAELLGREDDSIHRVRIRGGGSVKETIERVGEVPLPPYIKRDGPPGGADRESYQTIYARRTGAVAAPTAGLHFTQAVLSALDARGIERAEVTLHVGYGTFAPPAGEDVSSHRMHEEAWEIGPAAAGAVNQACRQGRRVVAVGTTTVRALESAALAAAPETGDEGIPRIAAGAARTSLFIVPGFRFRIVSALLTNFHLPRSTLLMLVCAFAGREPVLAAYREAIERGYRFYSYGDAMLIL